jgi:mono/diheme cytochrome c family protein
MRRSLALTCLLLPIGLGAVAARAAVSAQTPAKARTLRDGLYTEAQAARGKEAYLKACAECHMPDLAGHEYAGALAGFGFQLKWEDASLAEVYGRIRTMPLGRGGTLPGQEYLDITAFVLQSNGYPSGGEELDGAVAGQRWPRIVIERKK